jgi:hypothetical protein
VNALEGQLDALKESYIGTTVFERSPTYDPKLDPVVRVEAWRLRTKLQTYYETEGCVDRIVIQLPNGGYLPIFEEADTPAVPALPSEEFDRENGITEAPDLSANIERAFPANFRWLAAKSWKRLRDEFKLAAMELSMRFLEFFQLQRNGHAPESRSSKHLARE